MSVVKPSSIELRRLAEEAAAPAQAVVEDITVRPAGKRSIVTVTVDAEFDLPLDTIAEISRELSAALDVSTVMGEKPYVLEVTTRGATADLCLARHWRRAIGRRVNVKYRPDRAEQLQLLGTVVAVDGDAEDFTVTVRPVDADSGADGQEHQTLTAAAIESATVELDFRGRLRTGDDDGH